MTPTAPHPSEPTASALAPFLERQGVVVLDGGLATELEARGLRLDDRLWSARLLLDEPEEIGRLHRDYLDAGADCITTASYQATYQGLAEAGIDEDAAGELLRRSVRLAVDARDGFWSVPANRAGRLRPLVAASVGPYGAYLADGSEYSGRYGLSEAELRDFHERRFRLLAASGADLLALETIPSLPEARALMSLLADTVGAWAWISFSCPDGVTLADGTPLADAARACADTPRLAAIGVNCVPPRHVPSLVAELRTTTSLPVLAYPNSGEGWSAPEKRWSGREEMLDWEAAGRAWVTAGAAGVGGCCRTGPAEVRRLRAGTVMS